MQVYSVDMFRGMRVNEPRQAAELSVRARNLDAFIFNLDFKNAH